MFRDITGQRFGKLIGLKHDKNHRWIFKCDCGEEKSIYLYDVTLKKTKSCGCWNKQISRLTNRTHGMSHNRFNRIWACIHTRVSNKNRSEYSRYGGRGIKCLWKSFEEFRDDMYKSYLDHVERFGEKNTQIDRIDFNSGYSKENCRWVTLNEQANNKRDNLFIEYRGERMTVAQWAVKLGMNYQTLYIRLKRWSLERAMTEKSKIY